MNVLVVTTVHDRSDTRIFLKECVLISSVPGVALDVIVADGKGEEQTEHFTIHDLGKSWGGKWGRVFTSSFRLFKKIKLFKPKVVHFHDPELIPLGVVLTILGIKVIYDVHESVVDDIHDKYWIPPTLKPIIAFLALCFEKLAGALFFRIIAATPHIAKSFPENKTILVQNFPDLNEFIFNDDGRGLDPNKFVYLGAITEIRGVGNLIKAAEISDNLKIKLHLAGGFSPSELSETYKSSSGWKYVDYYGHLSRERLHELFENATAGCVTFLPARNHIYSQPNKLFEYMAAGIAVIASDFPMWREIIETHNCGVLVDPTDPNDIARAYEKLNKDPHLAAEMGANGVKAVKDYFNWNIESKKLFELYELLSSKHSL